MGQTHGELKKLHTLVFALCHCTNKSAIYNANSHLKLQWKPDVNLKPNH